LAYAHLLLFIEEPYFPPPPSSTPPAPTTPPTPKIVPYQSFLAAAGPSTISQALPSPQHQAPRSITPFPHPGTIGHQVLQYQQSVHNALSSPSFPRDGATSARMASPAQFVGAQSTTADDVGMFNGGSYRISHRDSNTLLTVQLAMGCPIVAKSGKFSSCSAHVSLRVTCKFVMKVIDIFGECCRHSRYPFSVFHISQNHSMERQAVAQLSNTKTTNPDSSLLQAS